MGAILSTLADQAAIDWSKPLAAWSKREMTGFLELAMRLIDERRSTLKDDGFPDIPTYLRRTTAPSKPAAGGEPLLDDDIPF